ncbi:MAG TPA: hypothetical protein VGW97_02385 [Chthoniobacterales bacterium]|jgi:hypothetical protein|nr:hypothetical protein [Chthoniobacterales bacterium]
MTKKIPKASRTRLLRLISARADLDYATEAFNLMFTAGLKPLDYHLFVSGVVAYCRPFTESEGIGSLRCEYPDYPDFADAEMNARHQRFIDIRNKFLGHSSIHGTRALLLAPGSRNPATEEIVTSHHYAVAKRHFLRLEFIQWLAPVINALVNRVSADLEAACSEIGRTYLKPGETFELDTAQEDFAWSIPKRTK